MKRANNKKSLEKLIDLPYTDCPGLPVSELFPQNLNSKDSMMTKNVLVIFGVLVICLMLIGDLEAQGGRRRARILRDVSPQPTRTQDVVPSTVSSVKLSAKPQQSPLTAGNALSFALDPRSRDVKKAKGNHLIRRISLLESVPETKNLQIAFVIDGTDSMGLEFNGVKQSVLGIVDRINEMQPSGHSITLSLVVYRDTGAETKGGEILIPSKAFTTDCDLFSETVGSIKTVGGEPLFPESVDLGLYRAIHELEWDMEESTERWIILIGDAPPFPEGYNRPQYKARRSYPTDILIKDANEKGIRISCILCSSGFTQTDTPLQKQLLETYQKLLPETEEFFKTLYKETNGCTYINLADELTQKTLVAAFGDPPQVKIAPITLFDVETKQREIAAIAVGEPIHVAVVPFSFINQSDVNVVQMDKLPDDEYVAIAVPLQESLKQIPSLVVSGFYDVQYKTVAFSRPETPTVRFNTADHFSKFDAEWFLQGSVRKHGDLERIRLSLFHRDDPDNAAANFSFSGSVQPDTAEYLFKNLMADLRQKKPDANILKAFEGVDESQDIWKPFGQNALACRRIAQAMISLENAIGLFQDEMEYGPKVQKLLEQAESYLLSALQVEPNNPYAHSLLANCYYNQIDDSSLVDQIVNESNVLAETERKNAALRKKVLEHSEKADQNKGACVHELIRTEIEADHALFNGDFKTAIAKYESLVKGWENAKSRDVAVRAHWALAGIYAGDWGAAECVNAELSREHIVAVLAGGQGSQQCDYFTRMLEWDDERGTQHPYVRKAHFTFVPPKQGNHE